MLPRISRAAPRAAMLVWVLASITAGSVATGLLVAPPVSAAPADCPEVTGGRACALVDGGSEIAVFVSDQGGGALGLDRWLVGGREQLFFDGFSVRDFSGSDPAEIVLEAATVDAETGEIDVDLTFGSLRLSVTFSLQDGPTSVVEETIMVASDFDSVSTRLYVVNDFDLDGGEVDALVFADPSGLEIIQSDGPVSARVEWIGGELPDGFDVAPCCDLGALVIGDATFTLAGRTVALGPADFQSALSWDRSLDPGESFSVVLRKTIDVPEPDAFAGGAAAGTAIGLAAARRRRRRTDALQATVPAVSCSVAARSRDRLLPPKHEEPGPALGRPTHRTLSAQLCCPHRS